MKNTLPVIFLKKIVIVLWKFRKYNTLILRKIIIFIIGNRIFFREIIIPKSESVLLLGGFVIFMNENLIILRKNKIFLKEIRIFMC